MLNLPLITLCTVGSKRYEDSQQNALDASVKGIKFGMVKNIIVDTQTIEEWNRFIVYDLTDYIDTPYALIVHPDGYVVNPETWSHIFMEYDFVGAPFPLPQDDYSYRTPKGELVRVGNSVSLRSKRLLDAPRKLELEWKSYFGNYNEDGFICCHNRHILEAEGIKFAPIEVAKYFSRENEVAENENVENPFCFHKRIGRNHIYKDYEI